MFERASESGSERASESEIERERQVARGPEQVEQRGHTERRGEQCGVRCKLVLYLIETKYKFEVSEKSTNAKRVWRRQVVGGGVAARAAMAGMRCATGAVVDGVSVVRRRAGATNELPELSSVPRVNKIAMD